jgi:bla regulator protein blaR1
MIIYLLKSSAVLFVLYLFYKLFLEEENMHVFKRYYLLLSIVAAFGIPLLTYIQYVEPATLNLQTNMSETAVTGNLSIEGSIPQYQYFFDISISILWLIYALGVILMGFRFLNNLINIYTKIKHNTLVKTKQYSLVLMYDRIIPHTFLHYIFLHKQNFTDHLIPNEVLIHEQTHALQKHSVDILFIELFQIVFWFNPLFYFIKKSIKLNHEFLADQAVLNNGVQIPKYQKILLIFSSNSTHNQLTHAINYSLIKKRFTVMKTQTSKKNIWLRSMVILPLLAVLIYGFSEKVTIEKEAQIKATSLSNNNYRNTDNSNQTIQVNIPDINVKINNKNIILLNNEKLVTLKTIGPEIKKIIAKYNQEQIEKIVVTIEAPETIDMGFVIDITEELRKAGVNYTRKYIAGNSIAPVKSTQDKYEKATKEQIGEYNKIAKKYNNMLESNMIIIKKEVGRLNYLYRIMSVKQRKNAEPYPVFPPPLPSPSARKYERDESLTPPPPLPNNPTFEQKEKYKKTAKRYKAQAPANSFEYKSNNGELVEIVEVPLSPSSPNTPMELILEMANKDARFYYNGEIISSKEAIKIMKSKNNINLAIISGKSKKPIVNLYDKFFKTRNLITE